MTTGNEVLEYFGYMGLTPSAFAGLPSYYEKRVVQYFIKNGLILFGDEAEDIESLHDRIAHKLLEFPLFEINNDYTRKMVVVLFKLYLENNGVSDYSIVCDFRNNTNLVVVHNGFVISYAFYWNGDYTSRTIDISPSTFDMDDLPINDRPAI